MKVNQKLIKSEITKFLTQDKISAGSMNGTIKKIVVVNVEHDWNGSEGKVAVFYKNCKTFTNHENVQTERPCELFDFTLEYIEDDCSDFDFWLDESDFFDSISSEWQDKKADKMSDSEFVGFWI